MLANCLLNIVPRWLTIRNVSLAVKLVHEPFGTMDPTIVQSLAALSPAQIPSILRGYLSLPFPNLTIFQGFSQIANDGPQSALLRMLIISHYLGYHTVIKMEL